MALDEVMLGARAAVLRDAESTRVADAVTVSAVEDAVAARRWWASHWAEGLDYVAGLVAQDVQDALLETHGRWPLCPSCEGATHALYIHPEIGGPDPTWVCEETGRGIAPLGALPATRPLDGPGGPADGVSGGPAAT